MKSLKSYLKECFAVPATTIGIGNVEAPSTDNSNVGSGDIMIPIGFKRKRKRKFKKLKNNKRYENLR